MPQFDFQHVFWPQVVWLAIFFAILYFGVVRLTLPKIGRVMNEREAKVGDDLDSAERAKQEADSIAQRYEAGIAEAQANARSAVTEAKANVSRSIEQKLAALATTLHERQEQAEAELAEARKRAMTEIESVAAEAAAEIVERLTGVRPADADIAAAAGRALEQA